MPIIMHKDHKVVGVIEVLNKQGEKSERGLGDGFSGEDERILKMICHLAAMVIHKTAPNIFALANLPIAPSDSKVETGMGNFTILAAAAGMTNTTFEEIKPKRKRKSGIPVFHFRLPVH
eukprot:TRINITY_DN4486_c0_g2_i1.p2 TRINITY_DN4486_c0_g2~~TRINITY_DN4486_c0_g2_i1.p2  ORF type:complete len:119 (+),score=45.76 TRINITY_DN4486_c0_g2_i1:126-482(+)